MLILLLELVDRCWLNMQEGREEEFDDGPEEKIDSRKGCYNVVD